MSHARRLKPSSLATDDRAWDHARRLKPSSLVGEDMGWHLVMERALVALVLWDGERGRRSPRARRRGNRARHRTRKGPLLARP